MTAGGGLDGSKWNTRTKIVFDILKAQFAQRPKVLFKELSEGATRRVAASCFLEMLQLTTWGLLQAHQTPLLDIEITPTVSGPLP